MTQTFKEMYIHFPTRPHLELFIEVELNDQGVQGRLKKQLMTAGKASQLGGLIGMLFNKIGSSLMKKENLKYSFNDVRKMEVTTLLQMNGKMHNIMLWKCSPEVADNHNFDCILSVNSEQLLNIKNSVKPLMSRVKYSETSA